MDFHSNGSGNLSNVLLNSSPLVKMSMWRLLAYHSLQDHIMIMPHHFPSTLSDIALQDGNCRSFAVT
ncbi:hypothetical protein Nepgr_015933 [Nepenthes gracilis]|uniref:Uncharacterized protein n=1 Tax=Nepenthes gracilis TaxID=150966 RepID=A0AAD3SMX6_NEPGR|nr:hypothetical protein Nepgr_015933 [Nepenthes gracilis]